MNETKPQNTKPKSVEPFFSLSETLSQMNRVSNYEWIGYYHNGILCGIQKLRRKKVKRK